jgi:hypothetical protein
VKKIEPCHIDGNFPHYRGNDRPSYVFKDMEHARAATAHFSKDERRFIRDRIREDMSRLYVKGSKRGVMTACDILNISLNG